MNYIQRSITMKWPILLLDLFFLMGGIILITGGFKIKKQSKGSGIVSIILGVVIVLVSLYFLLWTFVIGYNS